MDRARAHRAVRAAVRTAGRHGRRHAVLVAIAFCLFWVPVIIFAKLADDVSEREPIAFDASVITWLHAHHTPVLDAVFLFATSLGQPLSVVGIGTVVLGVCLLLRRYRAAGTLVAGVGGAALANVILKLIFTRPRPTAFPALLPETGYSFPSGHSMVTAAFVVTLVFILWRTRWRLPSLIAGAIVVLAVGISRVYIGVHYPSDVIAGWAVGTVWAVLAGSLVLDFPFRLHVYISRLLRKRA